MIGMNFSSYEMSSYDGELHDQFKRTARKKLEKEEYIFHYLNTFRESPDKIAFCAEDDFFILKKLLGSVHMEKVRNFRPKHLWDFLEFGNKYYIDHHQGHAANAFLSSPFDEADILAIDSSGFLYNCIFVDKNFNIHDLSKELRIGKLWSRMSEYIFQDRDAAGKVMGLAAYGEVNERFYKELNDLVTEKDSAKIMKVFRASEIPHTDKAATLQEFTILKVLEYIIPLKTSNNICMGGGVAYNGYLNEELTEHWDDIYTSFCPGDEGLSIGAYQHAMFTQEHKRHYPSVFNGPEHNIDPYLFAGYYWDEFDTQEIPGYIADAIALGKTVGWYQGKSETGKRALGNRSILADPRNPNMKDFINTQIKHRENFRPFAPSVLEEHADKYFKTKGPSPYMSRICDVISDEIPAVTHVDGTSRIQTVTPQFNEKFYNLIQAFYERTGVPMLLNTSFNSQEEIVESPADALRTFVRTDLDVLVINNYIIRKTLYF